jgi:hypothetical protein
MPAPPHTHAYTSISDRNICISSMGSLASIQWDYHPVHGYNSSTDASSSIQRCLIPSSAVHPLAPLTQAVIIAANNLLCAPCRITQASRYGAAEEVLFEPALGDPICNEADSKRATTLLQDLSNHEYELRLALVQRDETIASLRAELEAVKARLVVCESIASACL